MQAGEGAHNAKNTAAKRFFNMICTFWQVKSGAICTYKAKKYGIICTFSPVFVFCAEKIKEEKLSRLI